MNQPIQITFRDIPYSEFVEARIKERFQKLEKFYDQIMGARVVIESPHNHHHKGNLYHVSIDITVPDDEIIVNRTSKDHAHEDVYVAIRDAFDAATRQLQEFVRKRRGKVKKHQEPLHGVVAEIIEGESYGRIMTPDGREIYFHKNSLVDSEYQDLEIGSEVWFAEAQGDAGPQASTVHAVGKHHHVSRIH